MIGEGDEVSTGRGPGSPSGQPLRVVDATGSQSTR